MTRVRVSHVQTSRQKRFYYLLYLLVPERPKDVFVMAGIANKLPFKKCDVDDGRVKVDKLKDENFEGQVVIVLRLRSVHF